MKKSLYKKTLCALVIASVVSSTANAQKKTEETKINIVPTTEYYEAVSPIDKAVDTKFVANANTKNRLPDIARVGFSIAPKYNPKVSIGIKLGPLPSNDGRFVPYIDLAYYPTDKPIKRFSKEIINAGQIPSKYTVGLYSIPKVQFSAYASNGDYTIGAGLALIRKELRGVPWHHDIHSMQLSLSLRSGIYLHSIFHKINFPLELEGGVGYFRKTDMTRGSWSKTVSKNVKEQISTTDKDFFSYEMGFVYWPNRKQAIVSKH